MIKIENKIRKIVNGLRKIWKNYRNSKILKWTWEKFLKEK